MQQLINDLNKKREDFNKLAAFSDARFEAAQEFAASRRILYVYYVAFKEGYYYSSEKYAEKMQALQQALKISEEKPTTVDLYTAYDAEGSAHNKPISAEEVEQLR